MLARSYVRIMQVEAKAATCKQQNTVHIKCNLIPTRGFCTCCMCQPVHVHAYMPAKR